MVMQIGYKIDKAAVNAVAGAQAVALREWVNRALWVQSELAKMGVDFAAQYAALVELGFSQPEAEALVYKIGAMNEAALILSGEMGKPDPYNYVDVTADLTGFGRQQG